MIQTLIELLNEAHLMELEAADQYRIYHFELENRGLGQFASKMKEIAMVEMKHAEKLAERILSLKGEPILESNKVPKKGQDIPEMLDACMVLEEKIVRLYHEARGISVFENDPKSKDLFKELLFEEEGHLRFFKNIKEHVNKNGVDYIASLIDG